jgi:hypothetical protein
MIYPVFLKSTWLNYAGAFAKAHPGKNMDDLMQQTINSGILVRSEFWEVVESVSDHN